jgi:hypothetical protein
MRGHSGHLSGRRPIESDSHKTDGVLGTKTLRHKTIEYLGTTQQTTKDGLFGVRERHGFPAHFAPDVDSHERNLGRLELVNSSRAQKYPAGLSGRVMMSVFVLSYDRDSSSRMATSAALLPSRLR